MENSILFFSIIIPTFNRSNELQLCINKLTASYQHFNESIFEIIVSNDGNEELNISLPANNIKILQGPKKGPAANRNNGAKHAKGEWLIFLDDDIIPTEHLLTSYKMTISIQSDATAFEGAIFPDDWGLLKIDMAECPVNISGDCFWSANVCIQRKLFNAIGGFDENFTIAAQEDQEIFDRLKGYTKIIFVKDAIVIHPVRVEKLGKKIKSAGIAIRNWYKYAEKKYGIWGSIRTGCSSNFFAILANLRKGKIKSTLYNMYIILILFPTILSFQIKKIFVFHSISTKSNVDV